MVLVSVFVVSVVAGVAVDEVDGVLPIDESGDDGIVVAAGAGAGVVVDVDVVDVVVLFGSVMVPDVLCVSGVFGGSLPPHATRPEKHAPTIKAENFM